MELCVHGGCVVGHTPHSGFEPVITARWWFCECGQMVPLVTDFNSVRIAAHGRAAW